MKFVKITALAYLLLCVPIQGAFSAECSLSKDLSLQESSAFFMFNAHLSHLNRSYGRPDFEARLQEIIQEHWPKTKFNDVSALFYERVSNLVDQARLKDSIARTIGLNHPDWERFEWLMRAISLKGIMGKGTDIPFEETALILMKTISEAEQPAAIPDAGEWKMRVAEGIMRTNDMFSYLARWRAINGELVDERAHVAAQKAAMLSLGLVGAGVLYSSIILTAPAIAASATWAATLPVSPAVASLVTKAAELSVGELMGLYGSPGAFFMSSAYQTIAGGETSAVNNRTNLSCELSKQIDEWKKTAPQKLLSTAVTGIGFGAAKGALSFSRVTEKLILPYMIAADSIETFYVLKKLKDSLAESVTLYKMAEDAEAAHDHARALELLHRSQELAQESGSHELDLILVDTLSHNSGSAFVDVLKDGWKTIRVSILGMSATDKAGTQ